MTLFYKAVNFLVCVKWKEIKEISNDLLHCLHSRILKLNCIVKNAIAENSTGNTNINQLCI